MSLRFSNPLAPSAISCTIILAAALACDRSGGDDLPARFAALTPNCSAPQPYTPAAPLQLGRLELPRSDAKVQDTVTCTGPDAHLVISRDEHGRARALELTVSATNPETVRPRISPIFTGLIPTEAVQHISHGLTGPFADWTPFGTVSAASYYTPALGPASAFIVHVRWR